MRRAVWPLIALLLATPVARAEHVADDDGATYDRKQRRVEALDPHGREIVVVDGVGYAGGQRMPGQVGFTGCRPLHPDYGALCQGWIRYPRGRAQPEPSPTTPTDADVARGLAQTLPVPDPAARVNPPPEPYQVVGVETWLWIDKWEPVRATDGASGITVVATPIRTQWRMGTPDTARAPVTCGRGTPYDQAKAPEDQRTDCSYVYTRDSADQPDGTYHVTATVTWRLSYSTPAGSRPTPLEYQTRQAALDLKVISVQAVRCPDEGPCPR